MNQPVPQDQTPAAPESGEPSEESHILKAQLFSGPLPHPEIMAGYEQVLPGSADRILTRAENQQRHRHELDSAALKSEIRMELLGWISGTVVTIIVLVGSIWLLSIGQSVVGFAGIVIASTGIISNFLKSWRSSPHDSRNLLERDP